MTPLVKAPFASIVAAPSRMSRFLLRFSVFALAALAPAGCGTVSKVASYIPKPKLPDMSKLLPGGDDEPAINDPEVPFTSTRPITAGHTLRLRVFEGTREPQERFDGTVVVDDSGVAAIGKIGSVKIGGRMLPDAVRAIEGVFHVAGRASLPVHVHVLSVEGTKLVSITGDVRAPAHLQVWEGMSFSQAVMHIGGRRPGSTGRAVYLTRGGVRKFHSSVEALDAALEPRAGDIISLSPDL